MQPTIHLESKPGFGRGKYPGLLSKCIVGCIFKSAGLIITRESACMLYLLIIYYFSTSWFSLPHFNLSSHISIQNLNMIYDFYFTFNIF
jgi:hypothetical protein